MLGFHDETLVGDRGMTRSHSAGWSRIWVSGTGPYVALSLTGQLTLLPSAMRESCTAFLSVTTPQMGGRGTESDGSLGKHHMESGYGAGYRR
jgi:hypothetical protein